MKGYLIVVMVVVTLLCVHAQNLGEYDNPAIDDQDEDHYYVFEDCKDVDDDPVCGTNPDCLSKPYCAKCVHPGADDVGDGVDNDCNGIIDDDLPRGWTQLRTGGFGVGGVTVTHDNKLQLGANRAVQSDAVRVMPQETYRARVQVSCTSGTPTLQIMSDTVIASRSSVSGGYLDVTGIMPDASASASIILATSPGASCVFDDAEFVQGTTTARSRPRDPQTQQMVPPSGCCAPDSCWNGFQCVANQASESGDALTAGFRCEDGLWSSRTFKYTPDYGKRGFCPDESYCLFDPELGLPESNGKPEMYFVDEPPACIKSSQYILNDYCEGGSWTTRTKLLAVQLLDYANRRQASDYALLCGSLDEVMGPDAMISQQCNVAGKAVPCFNNVCVLTLGDDVIFGTSLNVPVHEPTSGILEQMGASRGLCTNAVRGSGYAECGTHEGYKVWFNNATNSIIFMPEGTLDDISLWEMFQALIFDPLQPIREFVFGSFGSGPALHGSVVNLTFYDTTSAYNKLYAAQKGTKRVFAFLEEDTFDRPDGIRFDYLGVKYVGLSFSDDPCALFEDLSSTTAHVQCRSEGNTLVVIGYREESTTPSGDDIIDSWTDITAKLRLS